MSRRAQRKSYDALLGQWAGVEQAVELLGPNTGNVRRGRLRKAVGSGRGIRQGGQVGRPGPGGVGRTEAEGN